MRAVLRRMGLDVYVPPPVPQGCITDVTSGDKVLSCEGMSVIAAVPAVCQRPGCGLILQLHGDTGSGPLIDGHTKLHELGKARGYIVISPSSGKPPPSWNAGDDSKLIAMTKLFRDVFRVDSKKVHVTGFSRGGFTTWRLVCDASDLFVSAAPGGAGFGQGFGERTCFQNGKAPAQKIDLLILMGRTDASVGYTTMSGIRDAARTNYGTAAVATVLQNDPKFTHNQWKNAAGVVIETFDHAYETDPNGPFGDARGHCFPGSTSDPNAPAYAVPCVLPNGFTWGQEVMKFFEAHPRP
jgi:poly(3-hydroxybutyrate) depolymerase